MDSEGDQAIIGDSLSEFEKLPPVIRCAMLLNDLKRVNKKIAGVKVETFSRVGLAPRERGSGRHSVLKEGRPLKYIPQINNFITKWNQDEYSESVKTYRRALCPLWGGASGHMHGLMHFWGETAPSAPNSTGSPAAVPVPCASMYCTLRGSTPALT